VSPTIVRERFDMRKTAKNGATRRMPQISEAELVVMRVIWNQSPATANQVVQALRDQTHWKPKTIHTLLSRLRRKGALTHTRLGREYLFRPLVAAADYAHDASRSFLGRVFGGEIAPFLACFLEREELTAREIQELRRLLDERLP
jgi:BlaI family transcriptional regulator, penicillinase repressor